MSEKVNYFLIGFIGIIVASVFSASIRNSVGRKIDSLSSRIPPIQVYEGQQFGNTNSERFIQIEGVKYFSHIEGRSVEEYVNSVTNLQGRVEGLKLEGRR